MEDIGYSGDVNESLIHVAETGMDMTKNNICITEFGALVIGLMTVDVTPMLREQYVNKRVTFFIDNFEVVRCCQTGRVRGDLRYVKLPLLYVVRHFENKFNMKAMYKYIPTKENPADWPSRDKSRLEIRLSLSSKEMLWDLNNGFTLDWMASYGNVMCGKDGDRIKFYSYDLDYHAAGVDVFSQDVNENSEGMRERGYCFPPFVMLNAVTELAIRCGASVVLVHPRITEPRPLWARRLHGGITCAMPAHSAERRTGVEFKPLKVDLEYTVIDFKK
jgi:hypothetical protein